MKRREESTFIWPGSTQWSSWIEIQEVVNGLDTACRRRLRQLAKALGGDEVAAFVWLFEATSKLTSAATLSPKNGAERVVRSRLRSRQPSDLPATSHLSLS